MPLTNTQLKNSKPTEKTQRLFDGGGLYLEISPKGGKWWRYKYRIRGKEKRISLGIYPEVSLKEARDKHIESRRLVGEGIDPSAHRKAQKRLDRLAATNTFESVAREWHTKQASTWNESHGGRLLRRLERDVFPWLGSLPINDITPVELLETVQRIEKRGAIESAHRVLGNCGQIFRFAVASGRASQDISRDLRGALSPVGEPKHFAAVTEPEQVGKLLRVLDGYEGTLVVKCALRLAPMVFVRPGELRKAKWEDVDLENSRWSYHVSKTNTQHIVPLATQAVSTLLELHPLTGHGEYVFPSARNPRGDKPMSDNAILSAMRRMDIGKDEMSGHGFRAMARTILDEVLGFRPDYIEHQLAHAVKDPNGRAYNRTAHLDERTKMMQAWADYLDKLKSAA